MTKSAERAGRIFCRITADLFVAGGVVALLLFAREGLQAVRQTSIAPVQVERPALHPPVVP
jgi:hypothetical protein